MALLVPPELSADRATSMSTPPKISIVINNYNYGRFLLRAIDSALAQNDDNFEVVVVDDGSTDNSVSLAQSRLSAKLRVIEKPNGGQASAINAGYWGSTGEWIMFLDSDDWYEPDALLTLRKEFQPGVAKVHFRLTQYHEATGKFGEIIPRYLSRGDVIQEMAEYGNYKWPPTSGNIFRRKALDNIMPMPEMEYKICADLYLCLMISAYGEIASVYRPLGFYRIHSENAHAKTAFQLNKKSLFAQAMGLLRVTIVAERLLKGKGVKGKMTELDRRENIEIVAIAARFGAIQLEEFGYSWKDVERHWSICYSYCPNTFRSRVPALLIWKVINHAPFAIVRMMMRVLTSYRSRRYSRGVIPSIRAT